VTELAANARRESNSLPEQLAALSQELDRSIERLDRICADIDVRRESARPTPTQQEVDLVAGAGASNLSAVLTGIVSRLDALCDRFEPCVDRLERSATSADQGLEEEPPPAGREATGTTEPQAAVQSRPLVSGPDELSLFREQVDTLVSRLQRRIVDDHGPGVELQVIRGLRERLDRFLRNL
jgi:hypothetical protein